jgi:hypothetical protein
MMRQGWSRTLFPPLQYWQATQLLALNGRSDTCLLRLNDQIFPITLYSGHFGSGSGSGKPAGERSTKPSAPPAASNRTTQSRTVRSVTVRTRVVSVRDAGVGPSTRQACRSQIPALRGPRATMPFRATG